MADEVFSKSVMKRHKIQNPRIAQLERKLTEIAASRTMWQELAEERNKALTIVSVQLADARKQLEQVTATRDNVMAHSCELATQLELGPCGKHRRCEWVQQSVNGVLQPAYCLRCAEVKAAEQKRDIEWTEALAPHLSFPKTPTEAVGLIEHRVKVAVSAVQIAALDWLIDKSRTAQQGERGIYAEAYQKFGEFCSISALWEQMEDSQRRARSRALEYADREREIAQRERVALLDEHFLLCRYCNKATERFCDRARELAASNPHEQKKEQ